VCIPAAGSGTRMGGASKSFLTLRGEPLLYHALKPFLAHPRVLELVVALAAQDAADPPAWLTTLDTRIRIVPGGATRAHSVLAALAALTQGVGIAMIHDAARPLVSGPMIDRCLDEVTPELGVVAGWPAVDTLKEVDSGGEVIRTPDRSVHWHAQTPQAFDRKSLIRAYERAIEMEAPLTDDAAVFAMNGGRVRMVKGDRWNLKVTIPQDLALAESLMTGAGSASS
jgi:2-C-methyl-D-erythritol 4-phosphate cytidylyltransferase